MGGGSPDGGFTLTLFLGEDWVNNDFSERPNLFLNFFRSCFGSLNSLKNHKIVIGVLH